jgi:hypothetical protein
VILKKRIRKYVVFVGFVVMSVLVVLYVSFTCYNKITRFKPDSPQSSSNRRLADMPPVTINDSQIKTAMSEEQLSSDKIAPGAATNHELEFIDKEVYRQAEEITGQALFDAKYSDPRNFIQLNWHEGISYKHAKRLITKNKLPVLYEMLEDVNYAPDWHKVATLIGYISEDPCSVPILLDYIKRDDKWNWNIADRAASIGRLLGKISALIGIGRIGGEQANIILRNSTTEEGATQLAKIWIEGQLPTSVKSKEEVVAYIKGRAAMGLISSRKPENIEIVRQLFAKEEAYCKENRKVTKFYKDLASAIAVQDFTEKNGYEAYLNLLGSGRYFNAMMPYVAKYMVNFEKNNENDE